MCELTETASGDFKYQLAGDLEIARDDFAGANATPSNQAFISEFLNAWQFSQAFSIADQAVSNSFSACKTSFEGGWDVEGGVIEARVDGETMVVEVSTADGSFELEREYSSDEMVREALHVETDGEEFTAIRERDIEGEEEPTGPWETRVELEDDDPNTEPDVVVGAEIGAIFGTQLGSLVAGGNPFAQVLAGSALATVLGGIGGGLAGYFSGGELDENDGGDLIEALDDAFNSQQAGFFSTLMGQASGTVSSFLGAELGEALGLEASGDSCSLPSPAAPSARC